MCCAHDSSEKRGTDTFLPGRFEQGFIQRERARVMVDCSAEPSDKVTSATNATPGTITPKLNVLRIQRRILATKRLVPDIEHTRIRYRQMPRIDHLS